MGHLKRLAAPPYLKISAKEAVFTVNPSPGPHPKYECIPLLLIVRDYLKYAERAEEAKKIIRNGKILVDGRPIKDYKFPVGLMDVVSIPDTGENYRILPVYRKGLDLIEIPSEESGFKLGKIIRRMHVPGGHLQVTLHDGRNIRFKELTDEVKEYKTKDTLKISVPSQTILGHLKLEEQKYGLLVKGPKQGLHGRIIEIRRDVVYPAKPLVKLATNRGDVTSILDYVMVVGEEEPWVKLP
ncbi:MAG: 30S ribosomal protein S4e [Thaumarchaeota archaeon]|nr:30S ribosomal protein S4e [Nitrososphaerota archaeon]